MAKRTNHWRRKEKQKHRSPGAVAVLDKRIELNGLPAEKVAAFYARNADLHETQIDWFHAVRAHAKVEPGIGNIQEYVCKFWLATWRTELSASRYHYLAHSPSQAQRRVEAYQRLMTEFTYDPSTSLRAIIMEAVHMVKQAYKTVTESGGDVSWERDEVSGATTTRIRNSNTGEWEDTVIVHKRAPTWVTAAISIWPHILEARTNLEAFDRGFVPGPRGGYTTTGTGQPVQGQVVNQQFNVQSTALSIPASAIPKAHSMLAGVTVDQAEPTFHPEEVRQLIEQEGKPWAPVPPLSMSYEEHMRRRRIHDAGGPLPYPQKDEIVGEAKTANEFATEARRKEMARGILLDPAAVIDAENAAKSLPAHKQKPDLVPRAPSVPDPHEVKREEDKKVVG